MQTPRLYKGKLFVPFTLLGKMNPRCQPTRRLLLLVLESQIF